MSRSPGEKASIWGEKGMRLVRSWEILMILAESQTPLSYGQIHDELHARYPFCDNPCSIQTTREDLRTLRKARFPLVAVNQRGVEISMGEMEETRGRLKNIRWRLSEQVTELQAPRHRVPTSIDLLALSLSRSLMGEFIPATFPLYRVLRRLLDELQMQFNQSLRKGVVFTDNLSHRVLHLGAWGNGNSVPTETLQQILEAVARRQVLTAKYRNRADEMKPVDFAPQAVWHSEGRLYILAAGGRDGKLRTWRADRLSDIETAHGQRAPQVNDQEVETLLQTAFRGYTSNASPVVLRVSPRARYLFDEYVYHPSQQLEPLSDGSLRVRLHVSPGWGLEEWILGFGELAFVEKPEELRRRIVERMQENLNQYHTIP